MADKTQNVQELFLNKLRKEEIPVTVYLMCGVKLQGIITGFDGFAMLLRRDGHTQLIYKHAVSTIMPTEPVSVDPAQEDA